jgi:protein-disulfide isomerase
MSGLEPNRFRATAVTQQEEMEDTNQPTQPALPPMQPTEATSPNEAKQRKPVSWFLLGLLFGVLITVGMTTIINAATTPGRTAQVASVSAVDSVPTAEQLGPQRPSAANAVGTNNESIDPNAMSMSDERPFVPKVVARPANTLGNADAPVMIIEYSDFNCGFCRRFHDQTLQKVVAAYVSTGKARISYKHYPFLSESSMWKAEGAECAAEQGKFWQYHDGLFGGSLDGITDEASVRDAMGLLARDLKLDVSKFQACLGDAAIKQRVLDDAGEGQRLGVTGTPSFLINGKPLVGAQPFAAFQQAIDAALAEKGSP